MWSFAIAGFDSISETEVGGARVPEESIFGIWFKKALTLWALCRVIGSSTRMSEYFKPDFWRLQVDQYKRGIVEVENLLVGGELLLLVRCHEFRR